MEIADILIVDDDSQVSTLICRGALPVSQELFTTRRSLPSSF